MTLPFRSVELRLSVSLFGDRQSLTDEEVATLLHETLAAEEPWPSEISLDSISR